MQKLENNPTWLCVVAIALRDEAGRYLMHHRPLTKEHGGLWEFPGGKVEAGEMPADALVREVNEELGIAVRAARLRPAGFAQSAGGTRSEPIVILLYTCTDWSGQPKALEGGEVAWFDRDEILALDKPPLDVELAANLFGKAQN